MAKEKKAKEPKTNGELGEKNRGMVARFSPEFLAALDAAAARVSVRPAVLRERARVVGQQKLDEAFAPGAAEKFAADFLREEAAIADARLRDRLAGLGVQA
jgi:hypothetical protein